MKTLSSVWIVCLILCLVPVQALANENERSVSGVVSVGVKYDSNFDLLSEDMPANAEEDEEIEDAYITEITALLLFRSPWISPWHLELELYGLTNLHQQIDDSWCLGRGKLYIGYGFGENTISLLNEARYFSEPDDTEFDNFRNTAALVYKRVFSPLWQGRIGYENIMHLFPDNDFFNYMINGGFVELRNTWLPAFSTYYSYNYQYIQGSGEIDEASNAPEDGHRHTGEIGFELFFARKNSLIGAYTYQIDENDNPMPARIGEIQGEDENLEEEVEFNFVKHKGMLLYSHRFNDRFTLSLYNELIHKTFPKRDADLYPYPRERRDVLFLTSAWLTARLVGNAYGKIRYLYRMSESNIDMHDFQDHIIYLGLEYRL